MLNKSRLAFIAIFILILSVNSLFSGKNEAETLWETGEKFFNEGRYKDAINYYEKSLSKCYGDTECLMSNYNSIGLSYEQLGDNTKSLFYYEKTIEIARKINDKEYLGANLSNSGFIYYRQGKYDKAYQHLEESQRLLSELNQKENLGITLHYLGKAAQQLGKLDKALQSFNESLKIGKEINNQGAIAGNLLMIGVVYRDMGQLDKALYYYEEALKIHRQINNPENLSTNLRLIGDSYADRFFPDVAISYYEEALKIQKNNNLKFPLAMTFNSLGTLYNDLNQFEKAIATFKEALTIFKELNEEPQMATTLNNLGSAYSRMGLFTKAIESYNEALKIEKRLNRPIPLTYVLNNLGMLYFKTGNYDKAIYYYNEVLKIDRKINNPHFLELRLNNLGAVYIRQKRYRDAEEVFLERAKLEDRIKPNIMLHSGLIQLYLETGRFDDALNLIKKNPPSWRDNYNRKFEYYTQLGLALKGKGLLKESAIQFLNAIKITEDLRQSLGEKTGFFGGGGYIYRTTPYREIVNTLTALYHNNVPIQEEFKPYGKDLLAAAFYFSELTKARTLSESIASTKKGFEEAEIPNSIRIKEKGLLNQLEKIEKEWNIALSKGKSEIQRLEVERGKILKELESLITIIKKDYPKYAALKYPKPFSPAELKLNNNEVLIEYSIADRETTVFVIKDKKVLYTYTINISKDELTKKVIDCLEPFISKKITNFSPKKTKELYDLILAKALRDINPKDKIIIVPDGILGLLPFEVLTVNEVPEPTYLIDKWTITYTQSSTALNLLRIFKTPPPQKSLFALGNPIYSVDDPRYIAWKQGKASTTDKFTQYAYRGVTIIPKKEVYGENQWEDVVFPPLPETEDEVKEIAKLFNVKPSPPDIFIGISATESNLKNNTLKDYRYIHFATHADLPGKVQGINEPFILLSQVENKAGDDGILTMSEVLGLKLNADMVVLSACSTGRGEMMEGEGVANFSRAFQHAGARSVLVSLWEVPSFETVEFMKTFYGYLKDGKSRGEALKLTKQKIKTKNPNPFYWAVFVLYGEDDTNEEFFKNHTYKLSSIEKPIKLQNGQYVDEDIKVTLVKYIIKEGKSIQDLSLPDIALVFLVEKGNVKFYEITTLTKSNKLIQQSNSLTLKDLISTKEEIVEITFKTGHDDILPYRNRPSLISILINTYNGPEEISFTFDKKDKQYIINFYKPEIVKKPALYIYPEKDSNIEVKLNPMGKIIKTIPEYKDIWKVKVSKDGLIDGKYSYLFYEAELFFPVNPPAEGWVIPYSELKNWFEKHLPKIGLNVRETKDFMDYWLKSLEPAKYYIVKILDREWVNKNLSLEIKPEPKKFLRLIFYFEPTDREVTLREPKLEPFIRDGFTAVEWGGIVKESKKSDINAEMLSVIDTNLLTEFSSNQQNTGIEILKELTISEKTISIIVRSGGCTGKDNIKPYIKTFLDQEKNAPVCELTFVRTTPDFCKAFFQEGINIVYDIEKDLKIKSPCIIKVTNPVFTENIIKWFTIFGKEEKPVAVDTDKALEEYALKLNLLSSTLKAIEMEIQKYEKSTHPDKKEKIAYLKKELNKFKNMKPEEYVLERKEQEKDLLNTSFGPLMPPIKKEVEVIVKDRFSTVSMLEVVGMTRSGPFYHVAGMSGELENLPKGRYKLEIYLVYKREYFGFIPNYYVYISKLFNK